MDGTGGGGVKTVPDTVELWRDGKIVRTDDASAVVVLLVSGWKIRTRDAMLEGVCVPVKDTDPPYWDGYEYKEAQA